MFIPASSSNLASTLKPPPNIMQIVSPRRLKDTILKMNVNFHGDKLTLPEQESLRM